MSVTSSTANGSYNAGDVITIQVQFTEAVTVNTAGGSPVLTLETGTTDRNATYLSGSGSNTLTFSYTVQSGDTSADLDAIGTAALSLNGATIKDADGNNAVLTLPSPGATGSLGASKAIVIDTTAPDTTITSTPAAFSNDSSPTFQFSSNETGVTFQGRIGSGAFTALTSPYTIAGLTDGSYTFDVRAIDAAGNIEPTPASYTWTVDTTAPAAPGLIAPGNGTVTDDATPTVRGLAEPGSTVTIFVDNNPVGTTTSDNAGSYAFDVPSVLADGSHTFYTRARDAAGNISPASVTYSATIDTTTPVFTIGVDQASTIEGTSPGLGTMRTFTVTRTGGTGTNTTVNYDLTGSAVVAQDYTQSGTGSLSFTAGGPNTLTFTVTTKPDFTYEGSESIIATLGAITGGGSGTGANVTLTITDDDPAPSDEVVRIFVRGTEGNDVLRSTDTNVTFLGQSGLDSLVLTTARGVNFVTVVNGMPNSVSGPGVIYILDGIERLIFSDLTLAFDQNAAQIYRLFQAAFDRVPDQPGLSYWVQLLDGQRKDLVAISRDFLFSAEFGERFGPFQTLSSDQFVNLLYRNILDRQGGTAELAFWASRLEGGMSREHVLTFFSESPENSTNVLPAIQNGILLDAMTFI